MTSNNPPPSDGSDTPPRSRPNLGVTVKDSAELDLWAFDDEAELEVMPIPKLPKPGIPDPRYAAASPAGERSPAQPSESKTILPRLPETVSDHNESIRVNVSPRTRPAYTPSRQREPLKPVKRTTPGENFDDLDQWEPSKADASAPPKTGPATMPPSAFKEMPGRESRVTPSTTSQEPSPEQPRPSAAASRPVAASKPALIEDDRDEFSNRIRATDGNHAVPLRPALNLKPIERIGLAMLVVLLVGVGVVFYFSTIRQIPAGSGPVDASNFPIQGNKVEAVSAASYWRKPITSGPDADTVQRETLLIPVAEFTTRGGPATLRFFFRNEHGDLVGDALTRTVQGEQKLTISATAGFDDLAKHAAYRTGQTAPWTIDVLEAPPGNPAAADFKRIFEMSIGTDRH